MKTLLLTALALLPLPLHAAVIQINLIGTAGPGLLFGNEPGVSSGGSGGEFGSGITFDDVTKSLSISVAWGLSNGFTNLTGPATNAHIHVTTNNNGNTALGDWTQTGGVAFGLTGAPFTYNNSASAGSIIGSTTLTGPQETDLMNGRYYINVHTAANGGGEIRGFLQPVPEPTGLALASLAAGGLILRRRRA